MSEKANYYTFKERVRANEFSDKIDEFKWFLTALECNKLWESAGPVTNHTYLERKQVEAFGLRQIENRLLVPIRDAKGLLWSLQTILPDGSKQFTAGGRKRAGFHTIGQIEEIEDCDEVLICEGYATGASLHMATGLPVIVAFDNNNMLSVAEALPDGPEFIIAADNDKWGASNPGMEKALAMEMLMPCKIASPDFDPVALELCNMRGIKKPTDWNDLHIGLGLPAIRKQLSHIVPSVKV